MNGEARQVTIADGKLKASNGAGDGPGWIEGYVSVYGNVDRMKEIMAPGCFAKSLREVVPAGTVKLLVKHFSVGADTAEVIGTVTQAREDTHGLWIHAELSSISLAQETRTKILEGHITGLSVGYRGLDYRWETVDGVKVKVWTECELWEATVTSRPANKLAVITAAKAYTVRQETEEEARERRERDIAERRRKLARWCPDEEQTIMAKKTLDGVWYAKTDDARAARFAKYVLDDGPAGGVLQTKRNIGVRMPHEALEGVIGKVLPMMASTDAGASLTPASFFGEAPQPLEAARIMPRCSVIPLDGGLIAFPRPVQAEKGAEGTATEFAEYGLMGCEWTAEGSAAPGQDLVIEQPTISTHRLSAVSEASRMLLKRATNLPALIAKLFKPSFTVKIDRAIVNGNGIGRPLGILQTADVQSVAREVAGEVSYEDLVNIEDALPAWMQPMGMWVVAKSVRKALLKLTDAVGKPLIQPNPVDGTPTLLGHPLVVTDLTTLGDTGDVLFGDFSQYVVLVETDFGIFVSEHRKIELGVVCFIADMWVGGRVLQPRAFVKLTA
ncbi:MAG: phage major capsid protein [Planctomycetota bacterium]|nr:phage major capsid protein [Planctomycetota bacterium]